MSVQLVVYPQNYQGYAYTAGASQNQYVADNQSFVTVGTGASNVVLTGSQTGAFALNSSPPIASWKKYNYTGQTAPTISGGNLILTGQNSNSQQTGVYQTIFNLIPGQQYQFTMNIQSGITTGLAWINTLSYSNNLGNTTYIPLNISNTGTTPVVTFTAQNTEEVLSINFISASNPTLQINSCSIVPSLITRDYLDPQDGQVIVDLYEEEEIPLTLSVDDFKNVAEKVQSYSKDFNLPATKRNNKIFDNIFEITRNDNGLVFNPYNQTKAILKEDGFTVFQGFLRLIEIKNQKGEISYNVNLYSEAVALADILQNKTFADINLDELQHTYNRTNILAVTTTGLLTLDYPLPTGTFAGTAGSTQTSVLKYPFCNWTGNILVTPTISSGTSNMPSLTRLEDAFRPWIQIKYLINRIFNDAGFTWTSNFFETSDFGKLFMDFNWGSDITFDVVNANNYYLAWYHLGTPVDNYATTSFTPLRLLNDFMQVYPPNYNSSTYVYTASQNNETVNVTYNFEFENTSGSTRTLECQWGFSGQTNPINNLSYTIPAGGSATYAGTLTVLMVSGQTLTPQFKASAGSAIRQTNYIQSGGGFGAWAPTTTATYSVSVQSVASSTLINTLRGELGQWDFFKGLMTMFNLVTLQDPTNPTNIIIEPYDDIFINNTNSTTYDWTNKVDETQIELKPLDLKKRTIFKYEEDDNDYSFNVYKNATNGYLYGSTVYDASNYSILTGEEEVEASPFASTVIKPNFDTTPDFMAPQIFGSNDDATEAQGIENKPRILYDVSGSSGYTMANTTFYIPAQAGVFGINENRYSLFSHTSTIPSNSGSVDYNFGSCQLIGIGIPPIDNLFNTYYSNYYDELYHPDTRILTLKVLLKSSDVSVFQFFDKVRIKSLIYRVNKINYKPGDLSTVEFILIT
jgi:hypothetical protein